MKKWYVVGDGKKCSISDEPENKTKPHVCHGVGRASAQLIVDAHNAEVEKQDSKIGAAMIILDGSV